MDYNSNPNNQQPNQHPSMYPNSLITHNNQSYYTDGINGFDANQRSFKDVVTTNNSYQQQNESYRPPRYRNNRNYKRKELDSIEPFSPHTSTVYNYSKYDSYNKYLNNKDNNTKPNNKKQKTTHYGTNGYQQQSNLHNHNNSNTQTNNPNLRQNTNSRNSANSTAAPVNNNNNISNHQHIINPNHSCHPKLACYDHKQSLPQIYCHSFHNYNHL